MFNIYIKYTHIWYFCRILFSNLNKKYENAIFILGSRIIYQISLPFIMKEFKNKVKYSFNHHKEACSPLSSPKKNTEGI